MLKEFKEDMMKTFKMIELGLMNYFLNIEVRQQKEGILISKKKYIEALLKKFKMYGCKSITIALTTNEKLQKDDGALEADASHYRSLIGSLLYLIATRLDIMYATKSSIKIHAKAKPNSQWNNKKNSKISTRNKRVW